MKTQQAAEILKQLKPLSPTAFLMSGLKVTAVMQPPDGQTIRLRLADAQAYIIIALNEKPSDCGDGVTPLDLGIIPDEQSDVDA